MEFLDISLTKNSSLLLYAFHSLSTGGFFRENQRLLWFKKYIQKIHHTRKLESMKVENQTHFWEDSSLGPETATKNVVQEFPLQSS